MKDIRQQNPDQKGLLKQDAIYVNNKKTEDNTFERNPLLSMTSISINVEYMDHSNLLTIMVVTSQHTPHK